MNYRRVVLLAGLLAVAAGAEAPTDPATAQLLKKFQGTWSIESIETDGVVNREAMAQIRYRFSDNGYSLNLGDQVVEKGTIRLDVDGRDWTIDLQKTGEKTVACGIYEFSGGKLRICFAPPGESRPQAYRGRNGHSLLVLTRAKPDPKANH